MTKAGYSKSVITPELGLGMAGFTTDKRFSTGVHDDLHTRVLAIEHDNEDFVIVQNELIGVDYTFSDRVKGIAEALGIARDNVFVGAIHTHSGPKGLMQEEPGQPEDTLELRGRYNPDMCEKIFAQIEKSIKEALGNKSGCSIRYNLTVADGIGANRNNKDVPNDRNLLSMEFVLDNGDKVLLYNFSCHPTVLNINNTEYTADWPYGVTKAAEGKDYEMVMFLNGAAGDTSTRFTRTGSTFDEAERLGGLLYSYITDALKEPYEEEINILKSYSFTYNIGLKPLASIEESENKVAMYQKELEEARARGEKNIRLFESRAEGAVNNLIRVKNSTGATELELRIQTLKLNDFIFVFLPGEMFSSLSLPIRKELGLKVVFITYFTGNTGYVADSAAYDNETYEAMCSPFKQGEGEKLIAKLKEVVTSIS